MKRLICLILAVLLLLGSTAVMLFMPKVFAILLTAYRGGSKNFGGFGSMCLSVLAEILISTMLAPIRMIFHSFFVVTGIGEEGVRGQSVSVHNIKSR